MAEVQNMTSNELPSNTPKRDIASAAIALGGLVSAGAAQRVGELPIRVFSTITGLVATGLGVSAFLLSRSESLRATTTSTIDLTASPAVAAATDVTVIVDLHEAERVSAPAVIDLVETTETARA